MSKTTAPSLFNFGDHKVRVVEIDGNPWFVAADVLQCLGIYISGGRPNPTMAVRTLNPEEVCVKTFYTDARSRPLTVISESGLYKITLRAQRKNPAAAKFQDWVTKEVLPAIRKDGAYVMGEEKVRTGELSEDEFILKAMNILTAKVERLRTERDAYAAEYDTVSMAEYVSSNHVYVKQSVRNKIAAAARKLADQEGIVIQKEHRVIETSHGPRDTEVNIYPRTLLDRVTAALGVFAPRPSPLNA